MPDARIRTLERAAATGDPDALERLTRALVRAAGRDPRVEPRTGDELSEPGPRPGVLGRLRITVRRVYRWKSGTVRVKYRTDLDVADWATWATLTGHPHPGITQWRLRAKDWFVLRVARG